MTTARRPKQKQSIFGAWQITTLTSGSGPDDPGHGEADDTLRVICDVDRINALAERQGIRLKPRKTKTTLAVAMVSESQGWTIGAIVAANLGFQAILYSASHAPSIAATMQGNLVVWSSAAVGFLLAELAAALLLAACTFYCQHRKTDFL